MPSTRWADRGNTFVRQWKLLVLLRRAPRTLPELSALLGVCQRTVRRDLYALQAVPFPIASRYAVNEGLEPDPRSGRPCRYEPNLWSIGAMPEWPRNDAVPVKDLRAR